MSEQIESSPQTIQLFRLWAELMQLSDQRHIIYQVREILMSVPALAERAADWLLAQPGVSNNDLNLIIQKTPSRSTVAGYRLINQSGRYDLMDLYKQFPGYKDLIANRLISVLDYDMQLGFSEFVKNFPDYADQLYEEIKKRNKRGNVLLRLLFSSPFTERAWEELRQTNLTEEELLSLCRSKHNQAIAQEAYELLRKLPETSGIFFHLLVERDDDIATDAAERRLNDPKISNSDLGLIVRYAKTQQAKAWELLLARENIEETVRTIFTELAARASTNVAEQVPVDDRTVFAISAGKYLLAQGCSEHRVDNARFVLDYLTRGFNREAVPIGGFNELGIIAARILFVSGSLNAHKNFDFLLRMFRSFPDLHKEIWVLLQQVDLSNDRLTELAKVAPEMSDEILAKRKRDSGIILGEMLAITSET